MTVAEEAIYILENVVKTYYDASGIPQYQVEIEALKLSKGEHVALVAPSGSGKSTVLNMLLLAMAPDASGCHQLIDSDNSELDIADLWRLKRFEVLARIRTKMMSFILQSGGLMPFLTAAQNINFPMRMSGTKSDPKIHEHLVDVLGIGSILHRKPADLSVGERQRVAIARALINSPRILIADEPTASLDEVNAHKTLSLMLELVRDTKTSIVLATHDLNIVRDFGFETLKYRSDLSSHGTPKAVFWRDEKQNTTVLQC